VSNPDWALIDTQNVQARPGQKMVFPVRIDGTRLQPGVYRLGIKATSGENPNSREVFDKAFVDVTVAACAQNVPVAAPQTSVSSGQAENDLVTLTANIVNPSDSPIENVSVELEGLPENWTYAAESGFTVPANSNKTLPIVVKRTTDEQASGVVLKIKSGDKVIGVQAIPTIASRASGLTGFFTAAGSNTWLIALIIIVALAVVVLSGKFQITGGGKESQHEQQHEVYAERLRSLKKKIEEVEGANAEAAAENADAEAAGKGAGSAGSAGADFGERRKKPPVAAS